MYRYAFHLSLFFSLCWPLAAQTESTGALRGTVVNEATGDYVEGAGLTLTGTNRTAVTDSQRRFHFGALPPADYRFKAEAAGNSPGELIVRVAAGVTAPALVRSRP